MLLRGATTYARRESRAVGGTSNSLERGRIVRMHKAFYMYRVLNLANSGARTGGTRPRDGQARSFRITVFPEVGASASPELLFGDHSQ